jgi:hypothetical protein
MSDKIKTDYYEDGKICSTIIDVDSIPDHCPLCHKEIQPIRRYAWFEYPNFQAIFQCPSSECARLFMGYYVDASPHIAGHVEADYRYTGSAPWKYEKEIFPDVIEKLSPKISNIYNEAKEAEGRNLRDICGAGYRKALEFLIKDY